MGARLRNVLLDTCTFVWLTMVPKKVSAAAKRHIDAAEVIQLSDVSALEIALKWRSGKLALPAPPRVWLADQAERWEVKWMPITREHILRASELELLHQDPYDRLLVAQALSESVGIVTPDEWIERYPVRTIW
jgi:PIN domain nuclease of toxin-antitoxin system